jgi:predicted RecB family endonuclease
MATQAKITSLEALELFRSRMIVFGTKARRSLGDIGDEVSRTRQWLQQEQRLRWESEIRLRTKKLEQAEQELMSAKLSGHREAILTRQTRVNRAKEALAEAQTKLKAVKKWTTQYDGIADPIYKQLDDLRHYLEFDLPQATAYLLNIQKTLESYTDAPAPNTSGTQGETTESAS